VSESHYDAGVTDTPGDGDGTRRLGLLSVVAPVYNEEATLEPSTRACAPRSRGCGSSSCWSTTARATRSPAILSELASNDPRVHVVFLSRNFGHQTALTAGLDHARGDAVVMLDADLQDPPELIPRMLDHWRAGCDVVYAVRQEREGESRFKLATARWFYRLFDKLAQWTSSTTRETSGSLTAVRSMPCCRCASAAASSAG